MCYCEWCSYLMKGRQAVVYIQLVLQFYFCLLIRQSGVTVVTSCVQSYRYSYALKLGRPVVGYIESSIVATVSAWPAYLPMHCQHAVIALIGCAPHRGLWIWVFAQQAVKWVVTCIALFETCLAPCLQPNLCTDVKALTHVAIECY